MLQIRDNKNESLTIHLMLGGHWISISLWFMEEIYVMGDKVWYRYPKAVFPPASWVFMCFEFDLANGTLTLWKDGGEPYLEHSKILELGNLTRKPDSLRKQIVLGKIQEQNFSHLTGPGQAPGHNTQHPPHRDRIRPNATTMLIGSKQSIQVFL